jgi:nucleotide-binding universal stress UspA family protein
MKTILVATDFSEASRNAFLYGRKLANAFNAHVILFNSFQQLAIPVGETPVFATLQDVKSMAQKQLEKEAKVNNGNVATPVFCEEGPVAETILQAAKDKEAGIIIIGMKSSGKRFRKVFGSTVTALARITTVPLIVVPEEAKYRDPSTIVLANETDLEEDADKHILDTLLEIGEKFNSKLYMVRVAKNNYHKDYEVRNRPLRLNKIVGSLDPQYEYLHGTSTPQVLNEFISEHNIDMLALLPHKHSTIERFFIKSITRSMAFETHVPLLIIPDLVKEESEQNKYNKEQVSL